MTTLVEAVSFLRTNILDDVGGTGALWEDFTEDGVDTLQLRWSNEELVLNIEEALKQVYRRILPIKGTSSDFDITSVIGTRDYLFDSRLLQIKGVKNSKGYVLSEASIDEVWGDSTTGTPITYTIDKTSNTLSLYPLPEATDTYSLLYYRLPLAKVDWESLDEEIELREEFVIPMLWFAASLCYEKEDADIIDPNRSIYFLQKFNQEFPSTSAYSDVRKRYTRNRRIRYGGI